MKVLLVDNNQASGSSLTHALMEENYVVNLVTDGETALNIARFCPYDLILLNLISLNQIGLKLCEGLRGNGYRGFIMMLTSQGANLECDRTLSANSQDSQEPADGVKRVLERVDELLLNPPHA